ncbi:unnamed protein product [Calypogeia fissa]
MFSKRRQRPRPHSPGTPPRSTRNLVRDYSSVSRNSGGNRRDPNCLPFQPQGHSTNLAKKRSPSPGNAPRVKIFLSRKDPYGLRVLSQQRKGSPLQKGTLPIKSVGSKERTPKSGSKVSTGADKRSKSKNMKKTVTDSKLLKIPKKDRTVQVWKDCSFPIPFRALGKRKKVDGNGTALSSSRNMIPVPSQTFSRSRKTPKFPRTNGAMAQHNSGSSPWSHRQPLSPAVAKFRKKMQSKYEHPIRSHLHQIRDVKPNLDSLATSRFVAPEKRHFMRSFDNNGNGNQALDSQKKLKGEMSKMDRKPEANPKTFGGAVFNGDAEKLSLGAETFSPVHDQIIESNPVAIHDLGASVSTMYDTSKSAALQSLSDTDRATDALNYIQPDQSQDRSDRRNSKNISTNYSGNFDSSDCPSSCFSFPADSHPLHHESNTVNVGMGQNLNKVVVLPDSEDEGVSSSAVQFQRNPDISKLLSAYQEALIKEVKSPSYGTAERESVDEPGTMLTSKPDVDHMGESDHSEPVIQSSEKIGQNEAYSSPADRNVVDASGFFIEDGLISELQPQQEQIYEERDSGDMRERQGADSSPSHKNVTELNLALPAETLQLLSQIPPESANDASKPRVFDIEIETVQELVLFNDNEGQEEDHAGAKDAVQVIEIVGEPSSVVYVEDGGHKPLSGLEDQLSALVTSETQPDLSLRDALEIVVEEEVPLPHQQFQLEVGQIDNNSSYSTPLEFDDAIRAAEKFEEESKSGHHKLESEEEDVDHLPQESDPRQGNNQDDSFQGENDALKSELQQLQKILTQVGREVGDVHQIEEMDHHVPSTSSHELKSESKRDGQLSRSVSSKLLLEILDQHFLNDQNLPHEKKGKQHDFPLEKELTGDNSNSLGKDEYESVVSSPAMERRGSKQKSLEIANDEENALTRSTMIDQNFPKMKFSEKLAAWETVARRPTKQKRPSDDLATVMKMYSEEDEPSESESPRVRGLDLATSRKQREPKQSVQVDDYLDRRALTLVKDPENKNEVPEQNSELQFRSRLLYLLRGIVRAKGIPRSSPTLKDVLTENDLHRPTQNVVLTRVLSVEKHIHHHGREDSKHPIASEQDNQGDINVENRGVAGQKSDLAGYLRDDDDGELGSSSSRSAKQVSPQDSISENRNAFRLLSSVEKDLETG